MRLGVDPRSGKTVLRAEQGNQFDPRGRQAFDSTDTRGIDP
jgi:hypothetical protein